VPQFAISYARKAERVSLCPQGRRRKWTNSSNVELDRLEVVYLVTSASDNQTHKCGGTEADGDHENLRHLATRSFGVTSEVACETMLGQPLVRPRALDEQEQQTYRC
jgi:hypothetical protein